MKRQNENKRSSNNLRLLQIQVPDSGEPRRKKKKHIKNSGAFITSTSAFAFHGKEWCSERQRAWHFIERHYTQSHGGPLNMPLHKTVHFNVKQSFAVFFLFSFKSPQLRPREMSELSSSVPVKRFKWQNEPVHFSGVIITSKHSHDPAVVVTSSECYTDNCQGSCDR